MKVVVKRSGGLTGMTRTASADTATLASDQAAELERLVAAANLDSQPRRSSPPQHGADRHQYDITVEADDKSQVLRVWEGRVPAELQNLINFVRKLPQAKVSSAT